MIALHFPCHLSGSPVGFIFQMHTRLLSLCPHLALSTAPSVGCLPTLLLPSPLLRHFLAEQPEDFAEQNRMSSSLYSNPPEAAHGCEAVAMRLHRAFPLPPQTRCQSHHLQVPCFVFRQVSLACLLPGISSPRYPCGILVLIASLGLCSSVTSLVRPILTGLFRIVISPTPGFLAVSARRFRDSHQVF